MTERTSGRATRRRRLLGLLVVLLASRTASATAIPLFDPPAADSPQVIAVARPTWESSSLDLGLSGARQVLVADIALVTNNPTDIALTVVPSTMSSSAGVSVPFRMFLLPKGPIIGLYLQLPNDTLVRPGLYSVTVRVVISDS